jgi:hypothetical protein
VLSQCSSLYEHSVIFYEKPLESVLGLTTLCIDISVYFQAKQTGAEPLADLPFDYLLFDEMKELKTFFFKKSLEVCTGNIFFKMQLVILKGKNIYSAAVYGKRCAL